MTSLDLTACDREPIHVPGAIQPHGLLLVADRDTMRLVAGAGDIEGLLGVRDWLDRPLTDFLDLAIAERIADIERDRPGVAYLGTMTNASGQVFDVSAHYSTGRLLVEIEPGVAETESSSATLSRLETIAESFERAATIEALCHAAATEFRRLIGYDRVMIYRFLDDDAGLVIGEDCREGMQAFMNHRFPASDIPRQARALYLRNLIRVIPDVNYEPAPIREDGVATEPLDLSDCALRSVSPIHLQYLKNMKIGASASVSIVRDGVLWGLVACHHETPLQIPHERRVAARALASAFARQLRVKDETDAFRERVRLRSFQDDLTSLLSREGSLDRAISNHVDEIRRAFGGDGVAIMRNDDLLTSGRCPSESALRALAKWALPRSVGAVFETDRLVEAYPEAAEYQGVASGLLAITLSASDPWVVLWFRAEEIQIVEWAGNPHKGVAADPEAILTPRTSFEAWHETVRGRSRRWTAPEVEAAGRLRSAVTDVWQTRRLQDLNRRLVATIDEKDLLLKQKEFLIGEVNHRVQNSLQLVSSFLALQARASGDPTLGTALEEARRRLTAVALVHRRLYRSDQVQQVDAARYVDELVSDISSSLGDDWARQIRLDVAPVLLPTERAISLGLILTELVINASKYAYGGAAGPLAITLAEDRATLRLSVADKGVGKANKDGRVGFGSRMMDALVRQLGGELNYEDNRPGLKATLVAPTLREAAEPELTAI